MIIGSLAATYESQIQWQSQVPWFDPPILQWIDNGTIHGRPCSEILPDYHYISSIQLFLLVFTSLWVLKSYLEKDRNRIRVHFDIPESQGGEGKRCKVGERGKWVLSGYPLKAKEGSAVR